MTQIVQLNTDGSIKHAWGDTTPVIALVPTELVLLTTVTPPKTSEKKIRQAIPYLIEDLLTEDPAKYHIVLARTEENNQIRSIAAVSHDTMALWLKALPQSPSTLLPDCLCLPWRTSEWTVFVEHNRALVRTGKNSGFACHCDHLKLLLETRAEEMGQPKNVRVFGPAQDALEHFHCTIDSEQNPEVIFSQGLEEPVAMNLLAHPHLTPVSSEKTKHLWKLSVILLLIWLGVFIVGHFLELAALEYKNISTKHQIQEIYKHYRPGETLDISNGTTALEQTFKSLSTEVPGNHFMTLLGALTEPYKNFKDIRFVNLHYQPNTLTLTIQAPDEARLNGFVAALQQARLTVSRSNNTLTITESP